MFFAAGASIIDAGTGGDGGEGAGDGGDAGDGEGSADADAGADEDLGGDADQHADADAGDENADADADANADPNALVDIGDGRTVPGKWKKLFDAAAKAGIGKEAKQLYFAQQRLAKIIPGGVNAAIQLAKDVEELGGVEGLQSMNDDLSTYRADSELFETNPAKWIETGFAENPDSALKSFAHSLEYVAEHHSEHYDHLMAKVIVNDIASGLHVREIHAKLAAIKDDPAAQALAKEIADYYNSRLETSKKAPEKKPDAQAKALTEREKKIEEREMNGRFADVNREVFPVLKSSVTRVLQQEAKTAGIDLQKLSKEYPGEWRDALKDIHQRVMQMATKDQRFLDKYYALAKKGELKRAARAVNDKHEAVIPDAVRAALAERGLFRGKKATKTVDKGGKGGSGEGNANANQNQGWARVSKRPENSSINWSKTTQAMQIDGKYILNDGKKVVVVY